MTSSRARWLAARTRNAVRHGLIIAGTGAIVLIAALLTFVLLPRQADRALSNAIAGLPAPRDTVSLRSQRARADALRVQAEAQRSAAQVAMAATLSGAVTAADSLAVLQLPPAVAGDSVLRDLAGHILRARQAPLVESFRSLADAPALQRDASVRAIVRTVRDSIEVLHRDREAYAALSGPDARYADMTARLTAQGSDLVALAERVLRRQDSTLAATTTSSLLTPAPLPDSLLAQAVRNAVDSVTRLDSLLLDAQRFNGSLDSTKTALRARMQLSIPPLAMLLASLVLGLSTGFTVSMWRELRRPTIGDARELEELTRSRVIVHAAADRTRLTTRFGRRGRHGEAQAAVLSPSADAWPLLHLTLSNIGDMARDVQILADRPVVAGAVGLNLAAVAARESRATVLVDAAQRAGAVVPLLPSSALTLRESSVAPGPWNEQWDASRRVPLGRDASVDLVLPRRSRYDERRRAAHSSAATDDAAAILAPLLRQYDFVVFVTDAHEAPSVPPDADLVLCARLGVTSLAWVSRAIRYAEASQRRIRAVVLWADEVPLAGTRVAG